jgi:hypothetical protein
LTPEHSRVTVDGRETLRIETERGGETRGETRLGSDHVCKPRASGVPPGDDRLQTV